MSLLEFGQEVAKVVERAKKSPDVVNRVLLYLEAAQAAVNALGYERQRILSDTRKCDVSDYDQVNSLWIRLDRYIHEGNIRPQLVNATRGLLACRDVIETKATGSWWRKGNKENAVKEFTSTLDELGFVLNGLTSNFYPGGSGMGVQTLFPLLELISNVRGNVRLDQPQDIELIHEQLGEFALRAIQDPSHEEWLRTGGKVEALVTQLQLAFSVNVAKAISGTA